MTGQQLKDSILLSAFSGSFVEHHNDDMSIFQRIADVKKEQERLIKAKQIKREKYNPAISEREESLPGNWTVVKLGDISKVITKQTGFDYSKHIKPSLVKSPGEENIPMLQTRNFKGKNFDFHTEYYISKKIANSFPKICLDEPCLLLSIVGASIGNVGYLEQPKEAIIGGAICKATIIPSEFYDYIYYFLQSPQGKAEIKKNLKATAQGTIMVQDVREIEVPLPPYEEQCRIVKQIESLFPLADEYDKAAGELEELNKILPDKLRKSILQEAIRGNLVSNDIPKGEAMAPELLQQILANRQEKENKEKGNKAKKLSLLAIEEEPYELPKGWCWCKIGDIADIERGGNFKKSDFVEKGYPCIHYGQIHMKLGPRTYSVLSYLPDALANRQRKAHTGDIVMAVTSENIEDVCKCTAWLGDYDVAIGAHTAIIRPYINPVFLVYFFKSSQFYTQKKELGHGSKVVEVTPVTLNDVVLPLPPLSIQRRIVEKIEEVFAAIDKLQA